MPELSGKFAVSLPLNFVRQQGVDSSEGDDSTMRMAELLGLWLVFHKKHEFLPY